MAQICPRCSEPTSDLSTRCLECGTQLFPDRASTPRDGASPDRRTARPKLLEPRADAPQAQASAGLRLLQAALQAEPAPLPRSSPAEVAPTSMEGAAEFEPATLAADPRQESASDAHTRVEMDPFPSHGDLRAEVEQNLNGLLDHLQEEYEEAVAAADPSFYLQLDRFAVSSTAHVAHGGDITASSTEHAAFGFEFVPAFAIPGWPEADDCAADATSANRDVNQWPSEAELLESAPEASITVEDDVPDYFAIPTDLDLNHSLQALDGSGHWRDCGPIGADGLNVGRGDVAHDFPGGTTLAPHHMRFSYELGMLTVEDAGSLNGVYIRLTEPVPLVDGMRFRIGNHTLEFREPEPWDESAAAVSADSEEFCSRDLSPLAYIDLIRPDGQRGLGFPITRADATIIGREGPSPHIALNDDHSVSISHAQIVREDGLFHLEDLRSRHGTFIQIRGAAAVAPGDVLLAGRVLFRIARSTPAQP